MIQRCDVKIPCRRQTSEFGIGSKVKIAQAVINRIVAAYKVSGNAR